MVDRSYIYSKITRAKKYHRVGMCNKQKEIRSHNLMYGKGPPNGSGWSLCFLCPNDNLAQ